MYSVIIPTLNASATLTRLIEALNAQSEPPHEIIVVDSDSDDGTALIASNLGCRVFFIRRSEFSHGGTRNYAALHAEGDVLLFMTQDALPADPYFAALLLEPLRTGVADACYARQIAYPGASFREAVTRAFNYPEASHVRTRDDVDRLGVRAYFFSNVASAVTTRVFRDLGMFDERAIMNEDMLFCAAVLDSGQRVAYVAEAQVFHSHNYGLAKIFQRYFDIGVFFSRNFVRPCLAVHNRGRQYSARLLGELLRHGVGGDFCIALFEIFAKFAGFFLGKYESYIPISLKLFLSMHKQYWKGDFSGDLR